MFATATRPAQLTDLFNFQGLRPRAFISADYSTNDPRLVNRSETPLTSSIVNEYEQLDSVSEQFDQFVQPNLSQTEWISRRKSDRNEIERLGDLLTFYDHKPQLNEFEQRAYKRLLKKDRAVQTDRCDRTLNNNTKRTNLSIPKIRLPVPSAMDKVEEFLATNHWRLIDLFKSMDKEKSWRIVKEDILRFIKKEQLNISEAQAEELLFCFCRESNVPMNYSKFARGRSFYKRNSRETLNKTPSSFDTALDSEAPPTPLSNYLQPPSTDFSHHYPPLREITHSLIEPLKTPQSDSSSIGRESRSSTSTQM